MWRRTRFLMVVAALTGAVAGAVRMFRGGPAPAFTNGASRVDPPAPSRPWPPLEPLEAEPIASASPGSSVMEPAAQEAPLAAEVPEPEPTSVVEADLEPAATLAHLTEAVETLAELSALAPPEAGDTGVEPEPTPLWVEPDMKSCPVTHPLKAKLSSGIYHQPGALNYGVIRPDRCYVDAAAAEADGLRPPKR